jgi:hypothetical protein
MALLHELEEDIGLFGFRVYISKLIDQKQVYLAQGLQEPSAVEYRGT